MKGLIYMNKILYNGFRYKKVYLFLSIIRVLILIILYLYDLKLNRTKIVI